MQKKNVFKRLWKYFTPYEKLWFISLSVAGILLAIFLPDEETSENAMLLTCALIALFSGILCELLISKQSRYNFLVSLIFVEITEIIICFSLGYYASAGVTILFWIPIDFISFLNWSKHKDKKETAKTEVRKFTWQQDFLIIFCIAVFSVVVGYLLQLVGGEETYIDALTSAFGICNGLFILFRFREQWIAWYLYTIFEGILWILAGQWIMLVLTFGYLTNTTYGYIKWTKYIQAAHKGQSAVSLKKF